MIAVYTCRYVVIPSLSMCIFQLTSRSPRLLRNVVSGHGGTSTPREPRPTRAAATASATLSTFPSPANPLTRTVAPLYADNLSGCSEGVSDRQQDITAKAPVVVHEMPARQSLDSARFPRYPRSAVADRRIDLESPPSELEEDFEDVGLDDQKMQPPPHRRRGFFSKFSDSHPQDSAKDSNTSVNTTTTSRFLPLGRKRGQSQSKEAGAELSAMPRPGTSGTVMADAQEAQ